MIGIFYNGFKIACIDDKKLVGNLDEIKTRYEKVTNRRIAKDASKYLISEVEDDNEAVLDLSADKLIEEMLCAIAEGRYAPCSGFQTKEVAGENDIDYPYDEEDDSKIKIIIPGHEGTFLFDPMVPKYCACGCPVCGGYLRAIGHTERLDLPDVYLSVCESCEAQIGFVDTEKVFFPLTDSKPARKEE